MKQKVVTLSTSPQTEMENLSNTRVPTPKHNNQIEANKGKNIVQEKTAHNQSNVASVQIKPQEKSNHNLIIDDNSNWKKVSYKKNEVEKKKHFRRQIIVGKNTEATQIKSVPKSVFLHVYRLDKQTTVDDLSNLLKPSFPEVKSEKLNLRYPEIYSSFKVTIYETNFKKAMEPSMWPEGACISKFFLSRKLKNQTKIKQQNKTK